MEHEGSQAAAPHAAAAALPGEYVNAVEIRGPLPLVINSVSALSKKNLSHRKPSFETRVEFYCRRRFGIICF